jgi:hypothetical protein
MNLCNFLRFNRICPVCGEPLKLYAGVIDNSLWQAISYENGLQYKFVQTQFRDEQIDKDAFFTLEEDGENFNISFSTPALYQKSKTWNFLFAFICNEDGIIFDEYSGYSVDAYIACYYRCTPLLEFKESESKMWKLQTLLTDQKEIDNGTELFTFKVLVDSGLEKVYILDLDYEGKQTLLRFYTSLPGNRLDKDFEPKTFNKDLPLLDPRPNLKFEDRAKLISRLDTWILMS